MINKKSLITIFIFSILLFITSIIKNETRKIEKNISKLNSKIKILEKDLYETQLDYFYLSSPKILSEKIWDPNKKNIRGCMFWGVTLFLEAVAVS